MYVDLTHYLEPKMEGKFYSMSFNSDNMKHNWTKMNRSHAEYNQLIDTHFKRC